MLSNSVALAGSRTVAISHKSHTTVWNEWRPFLCSFWRFSAAHWRHRLWSQVRIKMSSGVSLQLAQLTEDKGC